MISFGVEVRPVANVSPAKRGLNLRIPEGSTPFRPLNFKPFLW